MHTVAAPISSTRPPPLRLLYTGATLTAIIFSLGHHSLLSPLQIFSAAVHLQPPLLVQPPPSFEAAIDWPKHCTSPPPLLSLREDYPIGPPLAAPPLLLSSLLSRRRSNISDLLCVLPPSSEAAAVVFGLYGHQLRQRREPGPQPPQLRHDTCLGTLPLTISNQGCVDSFNWFVHTYNHRKPYNITYCYCPTIG